LNPFLSGAPVSAKITTDAFWNIGSTFFFGASGYAIVGLISAIHGAEGLGLFTLTSAVYFLASQFAAGGVHLSILKQAVSPKEEGPETRKILTAGMLAAAGTGLLTVLAVGMGRGVLGGIFHNTELKTSLLYVLPGLFFFSINKTIIAFLNARRRMIAYAITQAARGLLLLSWLILFLALAWEKQRLPLMFSLTEALLFPFLVIATRRSIGRIGAREVASGMKRHLRFGIQALPGNALIEINSRVDVLALGIFTSEKMVGIYSLASTIIEGFDQISVALRTTVNPLLAHDQARGNPVELRKMILRGRNLVYRGMVPIGLGLIVLFPIFTRLLHLKPEFRLAYPALAILMAGHLIGVGYRPFLMILNQAGLPKRQSQLFLAFVLTNVFLNILLIPFLGMWGAALGTSLASASVVIYLRVFVKKAIGIRI